MNPEVIEISDEESDGNTLFDRRGILAPVVARVVDALGGYEGGTYVMGDQVNGCLKDLKKLWRKDETDDERTVARLFWEMRVLPNDLVAILLETAGKGLVEDKRAINCVDLMTAMTWPIDMAEELKELDEELDKGTDYTQLLQSHLRYKVALLKPGVIQAMFGIMLPPLAKPARDRIERDSQVINVVLHLIRNLAFIRDLAHNSQLSSDQAEYSNLQSKLIRELSETHTFDLLLTIASNVDNDPHFNGWNTLVLEILYLLFRGINPTSLTIDQAKQPAEKLQRLLALENQTRRELTRNAASRHSRFGTTISVKLNPNKRKPSTSDNRGEEDNTGDRASRSFVLHRQQGISGESGSIMDLTKRQRAKKANKPDEFGLIDNLSMEARMVLQNLASEFVDACFNPFLSGLLKDIRSERPKITEKDNLRLLFVAKWFLEFFLAMRSKEKPNQENNKWHFGLVAEVTERSWIIWVLKRMREAVEEKPKLWTELQAGVQCLTQLLLLIDEMASSEITDLDLREAADLLQQQLVYNGEVLDIAIDSLKQYRPGTQSLAYLDASVYLAYALLRMLESWGKTKGAGTYVRQKVSKKRRKKTGVSEEDGIPDVEEEEEPEEVVNETLFTFEAFEAKFAQTEITQTLLTYLARYHEFSSPDCMRRVVSLLHRQAVKAKAEGLFFKVSTLNLFKSILAEHKTLPRDQPYKDAIALINYILRQFFKALEKDNFLAIETFFPKNRGSWKQFSSWEPESKTKPSKSVVDTRFPPDVEIKKGYSWGDQLGIAIAALVEDEQSSLVKWMTELLTTVIRMRSRIIEEIDGQREDDTAENDGEDNEDARALLWKTPSADAMAKITDYLVPYVSDEQADAATKNVHMKLLFRLCKFFILDEDADELEWYVPAAILVEELQRTLNVINQFLEMPFNLDGKKVSQLLSKKRRRRRRRSPSPSCENDSDGEPKRSKRRERKKKEKEIYKSAQLIEDSDAEYGDMDTFLEKEKEARQRAILAAEAAGTSRPATMKATGTKKRRKKGADKEPQSKKKKDSPSSAHSDEDVERASSEENPTDSDLEVIADVIAKKATNSSRPARPRPKARPATTVDLAPSLFALADADANSELPDIDERTTPITASHTQRGKRVILSDDED
ncbi:timeless protein-domain-containing protein [Crepidotus variabilis]|uniref:Timeless protein-domain-containing protein n=1 Tax=Crepidotus variabilis TaxID=179855 RepID=A0A9P6JSC5_9AGAR|nr:timeless protein-domain-containing protein [Crepidotus variabilis]